MLHIYMILYEHAWLDPIALYMYAILLAVLALHSYERYIYTLISMYDYVSSVYVFMLHTYKVQVLTYISRIFVYEFKRAIARD